MSARFQGFQLHNVCVKDVSAIRWQGYGDFTVLTDADLHSTKS
jgi:hypothetical protein